MLALNHVLVGAAIGSETNNIPVIVGLAVASHFILDALPHVDQGLEKNGKDYFKQNTKYFLAAVDIAISLVLIVFILTLKSTLDRSSIIIGAVSGLSIDLIFNIPWWENFMKRTPILKSIYFFHKDIQEPLKKYQFVFGLPLQIIIIVVSIWILLK